VAHPSDNGGCIAYIDGANLHMGIKSLKKEIDYGKFRRWLRWKYRITVAYLFIGYIPEYEKLYDHLRRSGYTLIFKETVTRSGETKGNVDAELVLRAVRDVFETHPRHVVLVSGDGDFSCLVDFLHERRLLRTLIAPNRKYCSYLLRKKNLPLVFMDDIIAKFEKTPGRH
jgi:uncharacterized LabA/DUF88 family protein